MLDLLKDIVKVLVQGAFAVLLPIGMVIGGAALLGFGIDSDIRILAWIGIGLLVAGIVWGAILYLLYGLR